MQIGWKIDFHLSQSLKIRSWSLLYVRCILNYLLKQISSQYLSHISHSCIGVVVYSIQNSGSSSKFVPPPCVQLEKPFSAAYAAPNLEHQPAATNSSHLHHPAFGSRFNSNLKRIAMLVILGACTWTHCLEPFKLRSSHYQVHTGNDKRWDKQYRPAQFGSLNRFKIWCKSLDIWTLD